MCISTLQDDLDDPSLLPGVVDSGAFKVAFILTGGRQKNKGPGRQQPGQRKRVRGKHIYSIEAQFMQTHFECFTKKKNVHPDLTTQLEVEL